MKTPILGSAYVARSVNAADNRMVNLFPEVVPEAGKEPGFLNRAPGLRLLQTVGDGPIRGMWWHGSYAYVVSGTKFYKVDTDYNVALIGTIGNTGPVSMTDNGFVIFIAADGLGYQYEISTNTLLQITDENFLGALVVTYIKDYFVWVRPDSQEFYYIYTFDIGSGNYIFPLVFDATQMFSAMASSDNLISIINDHNELWLFGSNSIEVWYQVDSDPFFLPIQGAFNELGCAATFSVAKMDNGLFWLGADARGRGMVYRANGYQGQRISTHAIEYAIAQYSTISDAIAYTYQQEGHSFYVLTFPTANATWVYDAATQAWHERAGWDNGDFTRHRSNCQLSFNNEVIVGDYANGNLYAFDLDVYDDNGDTQRWLRSWRALPTGQNDLKRSAHHSLQLDCESGVGVTDAYFEGELATEDDYTLTTEDDDPLEVDSFHTPGADPQVMLRWSDDGGHTWSNEHWAGMGKIGEFYRRVFWRRLGMTLKLRDRVYELSGTDPVKVVILGAELHGSGTNA